MQTVASREYKLMLKADRFKGDEAQLRQAGAALWADLVAVVVPYAINVTGTAEVEHKRRQVSFLDTSERWLRSNDYVVRERKDLDGSEREITLKFRHPDRYISQDRDMAPAEDYEPDMKFEEDIKPEFLKLYSFSSSIVVPEDLRLATLADVKALYPGLADAVEEFPADEQLEVVGGFSAYERVVKGTGFQIRKNPEATAECSLTVWYPSEQDLNPLLAEFSFKYESADESYSAKMARRAYDAYQAIQAKLDAWLDAESTTKTAYVYGHKQQA